MRIQNWDTSVTADATIRLALLIGLEDAEGVWLDGAWRFLFEQVPPPVDDDLEEAYVVHGVQVESRERGAVFVELKPGAPPGTVYYALDWLRRTIDEVNVRRRGLRTEEEQARQAAGNWYSRKVERT